MSVHCALPLRTHPLAHSSLRVKDVKQQHAMVRQWHGLNLRRWCTVVIVDAPHLSELTARHSKSYRTCLRMLEDCMTYHSRNHGGRRAGLYTDSSMYLFDDPSAAVQWCVDVQLDAYRLTWPKEVHTVGQLNDVVGLWNGPRLRMGIHTAPDTLGCCHDAATGQALLTGLGMKLVSLTHQKGLAGEILCTRDFAALIEPRRFLLEPFGDMRIELTERRRSVTPLGDGADPRRGAPLSPRASPSGSAVSLLRITPEDLAGRAKVMARALHCTDAVPAPRFDGNSHPACVAVRVAHHSRIAATAQGPAVFASVGHLLQRSAQELEGFPAQRCADPGATCPNAAMSLWMFNTPTLAVQWALQLLVESLWLKEDVCKIEGHESISDDSGKLFSGVRLAVAVYPAPDVELRRDYSPFTAGVLSVSKSLSVVAMLCGAAKGGEVLVPQKTLATLPKSFPDYVSTPATDLDYGGGTFEDVHQVLPQQLAGRVWHLKSVDSENGVRLPATHAELCSMQDACVRHTSDACSRHALRLVVRGTHLPGRPKNLAPTVLACHSGARECSAQQTQLQKAESIAMLSEDIFFQEHVIGQPLTASMAKALVRMHSEVEPEEIFLTEPPPESPRTLHMREMEAELEASRAALRELRRSHDSLVVFTEMCSELVQSLTDPDAPRVTEDTFCSTWLKEAKKGGKAKKPWKEELGEIVRHALPTDTDASAKRLGKSVVAHCGMLYQTLRTAISVKRRASVRRRASLMSIDEMTPSRRERRLSSVDPGIERLPSLKKVK